MPRPVHFEFTAEDPERAAKFYGDVFGWKMQKWEGPQPYWLIQTGNTDEPGIDGGMQLRSNGNTGTTNTVDVESLESTLESAVSAGAEVIFPKMAVPGVGWLAYIKDTEGNSLGLMQMDEAAA